MCLAAFTESNYNPNNSDQGLDNGNINICEPPKSGKEDCWTINILKSKLKYTQKQAIQFRFIDGFEKRNFNFLEQVLT